MSAPAVPTNIVLQTGNGQNLISWSIVSGATSGYVVQRSTDGVNFSTIGSPAVAQYLDTTCLIGVNYFYQVASTNGTVSAYAASSPTNIVPCLPGQINLGMMRYQAQLRADKLNSPFITLDEWNIMINKSMFGLFDWLTDKDGENFVVASPYTFSTTGAKNYALPDGSSSFAVGGVTPPAVYKMLGVDCGVAVGNNAWVTLPRYNWIDRNRFIYPQLQANALGVFNLSYRQMGNQLYFIPNPTAGQFIQIWYVPVMTMALQDTDMLSFSISGWDDYVIVDAARRACLKEESFEQAAALTQELDGMKERIEEIASNRDQGQPNTISDTRSNTGFFDGGGFGGTGHGMGGWAVALLPGLSSNHVGNGLLINTIFNCQSHLAYAASGISAAYLLHALFKKFSGGISLSRIRNAHTLGISSFLNHVCMVFSRRADKKMIRSYASRIVTAVAAGKRRINLSVSKFIRKTMRTRGLPDSDWASLQIPADTAISLAIQGSDPNPASAGLPNLAPKSFFHALFHHFSLSRMRDK